MGVRIAVVGLGVGRVHVRTLAEQVQEADLVAVCDVNADVAKETSAACGAEAFTDYEALLERARPEAVVIATPPRFHAEQALLAAERGIHVFCEKPMAPTEPDCERMIEAAARHGVTLMIGFKKRFYPCYRFIREQVRDSGAPIRWATLRFALGRVEKDWFWDEADGGGPLVENAAHAFDLLRFLMGEVRELHAVGGNLFTPHRAPQIDAAGVLLTFADGAVAALGLGYGSEWPLAGEELALASAEMVFELGGRFDNPDSLRYARRDCPEEVCTAEVGPLEHTFAPELQHFLDCVGGRAACEASGEDGLAALRIALAAKRSIREGRTIALES